MLSVLLSSTWGLGSILCAIFLILCFAPLVVYIGVILITVIRVLLSVIATIWPYLLAAAVYLILVVKACNEDRKAANSHNSYYSSLAVSQYDDVCLVVL